jgi:hypothetical protein
MFDHRGERCEVIGELREPPHSFPFMRPDTPLSDATRRRLNVTLVLWCVAIAVMLVALAWTMGPLVGISLSAPRWMVYACIVVFSAGVIGFQISRRVARSHWKTAGMHDAAALLAARGQCPSCASWLLTTGPDPDGRTTCPTCSAAWKVGNAGGCPGCGYDMSLVPATAGPLAICPECATLSAANREPVGSV